MNRTRRKAAKMFRRRYGKATNPFWQSQRGNDPYSGLTQERLDAAMTAAWNKCARYSDSPILQNLVYSDACPHCHTVVGAHPGWCSYGDPNDNATLGSENT